MWLQIFTEAIRHGVRLMSGKWVVSQGLRISVEYLGALGGSAATAGREAPSVSTEPTAGRIVESGVDPHFFSGDFLDRDLRKLHSRSLEPLR